jgi:hypothetical protein
MLKPCEENENIARVKLNQIETGYDIGILQDRLLTRKKIPQKF